MTIDWWYRRPEGVDRKYGVVYLVNRLSRNNSVSSKSSSTGRRGSNVVTSPSTESLHERPHGGTTSGTSSRRSSNAREGYCLPGIPEPLSFDRIRDNKPASPCTLKEFMCYLLFVERTVENMQFYMWYQDYCNRFANLPESEKAMSPEYIGVSDALKEGHAGGARTGSQRLARPTGRATMVREAEILGHSRSGSEDRAGSKQGFNASGLFGDEGSEAPTKLVIKKVGPVPADYKEIAKQAYSDADNLWQPFTVQPFRDEISQIISLYLTQNSPRELNISARDRQQTLQSLANTTHPSALLPAARAAETLLRQQSHPNFIRWVMMTGNQERFMYAHFMCVLGIISTVALAIILTMSGANRWYRLLCVLPLFIGTYVITAAYRGLCVVLHVEGHRCQMKPWVALNKFERYKAGYALHCVEAGKAGTGDGEAKQPWDSDYESEYNSDFETELKKVNYLKRMFGPTKYTQEPALRDIQDSIVAQSAVFALGVCICFSALFVPLPSGHMF